jgi:hypothetical protein
MYSSAVATDPVAQLVKRIESSDATLSWEPDHGYLKSLMAKLRVFCRRVHGTFRSADLNHRSASCKATTGNSLGR